MPTQLKLSPSSFKLIGGSVVRVVCHRKITSLDSVGPGDLSRSAVGARIYRNSYRGSRKGGIRSGGGVPKAGWRSAVGTSAAV